MLACLLLVIWPGMTMCSVEHCSSYAMSSEANKVPWFFRMYVSWSTQGLGGVWMFLAGRCTS